MSSLSPNLQKASHRKILHSVKMLHLAFLLVFSHTSSAATVGAKDAGSCPENWVDATLTGMGCLLFNTTAVMNWEDASVSCYQSNSSLVEIWTELQMDFLRSELKVLANSGFSSFWWTSATDLGREGHWYWASSLSPVPDFVWYSGSYAQPDGGTGENCAFLDSGYDFMIQDFDCDYESSTYPICQIK